jgi:hypothetical protein
MSKILIRSYEGTIYPEGSEHCGAVDLGYDGQGRRQRIKRRGRTKQLVKDRLIKAVDDLEAGIETSNNYTVGEAVAEWLERGTRGYDESTVTTYRLLAGKHLVPLIGSNKLKKLSAVDVDNWLDGLTGSLSTDSIKKVHSVLSERLIIRRAG